MSLRGARTIGMVLLLQLTAGASSPRAQAQHSGGNVAGAYATGHYRNLLAEAGHSQAEIDARLQAAFQQLFHGDPQTQAVYYATGSNANGPLAYINDVLNHDVRTEGMSYGMMVAVETGHKAEFDAIWNWACTYMLITDPANPSVGYFAWSMNPDGTPRSDGPAPDGEEYFAMSLYFAANRWGNGQGIYDYKAQADRILHEMRHHAVHTGIAPFRIHPGDAPFQPKYHVDPTSRASATTATIGPMVNEQHAMIVFVPGSRGNFFTDPSYHLPAFYQLWALWGPQEDRAFWAKAAQTSRRFFTLAANPTTGLAPDYANFDGTPHPTPYNPVSGDFASDSWRTVSNWSVDQYWWAANPDARNLSDHIQKFLAGQGMETFANRYTVEGKRLRAQHSPGMLAETAVGSLAASNTPEAKAFIGALWNMPVPSGDGRYFDGMLYMFALLHTSGQFRIWMPDAKAGAR